MAESEPKTSIDLAYDIAVDSYEPLVKRLDTMDGRLQTIMGFAATTMALVPSIASQRNLSFRSYWFCAAVVVFLVIIGVGTHARHHGDIIMLDPGNLFDEWLELEPLEFKKFFIEYAGKNWRDNNALVTWRWRRSVAISYAYFLQVGLLLVWVAALRL
jgi:hypothetical protein